ncbi:hypothetical protein [Chitinimonas sp. BJB300]|uniref:hypothetical protein n=1 Tax=Chitinimonas sp. BJB300 TaxID=1559339 RepID=UPI000C0F0128|nr:hypothetical protein [Chitinimonas sp. BJB300]PHV09651.1 hypothetical protein CSQ89_20555 [Chitinimonas sp. BJB300]TSJ91511.1 hypothetical protein FG002_004360 [Chitinimonas sp. BJB300]
MKTQTTNPKNGLAAPGLPATLQATLPALDVTPIAQAVKSTRKRKVKPVVPSMPDRRLYWTADGIGRMAWLPFVHMPKRSRRGASMWKVTPTEDYEVAYPIGTEYAAHFVQFLRDNPARAGGGLLRQIMADADLNDESGARGYLDGFIHYLELLLYHQAHTMDVYGYADQLNASFKRLYHGEDTLNEESTT